MQGHGLCALCALEWIPQVVRIMREMDAAKTETARSTETAYAVTSLTFSTPPTTRWADHPRVCGDHSGISAFSMEIWGSPPRMRAARGRVGDGPAPHRITPAYAGLV